MSTSGRASSVSSNGTALSTSGLPRGRESAGGNLQPWTLEDFDIWKKLGEGRFGKVYLAREKQSKVAVVLKCVSKEAIFLHDLQHQIQRECELQSYVRHRNVVRCLAFFWDAERIILVLEHCEGGDLFALLKQQPQHRLPESQAARYVKDIAAALAHLHSLNIIHRDVKPENILLRKGRAKLADFTWAVHCLDHERRQTLCGTLDYLAPEIVKAGPSSEGYTKVTDLWALGAVAYELVVGKPPFERALPQETCVCITKGEFTIPSFVSAECRSLLEALLVVDHCQRMTAAEVLEHPWLSQVSSTTLLGTTTCVDGTVSTPKAHPASEQLSQVASSIIVPSKSKDDSPPNASRVLNMATPPEDEKYPRAATDGQEASPFTIRRRQGTVAPSPERGEDDESLAASSPRASAPHHEQHDDDDGDDDDVPFLDCSAITDDFTIRGGALVGNNTSTGHLLPASTSTSLFPHSFTPDEPPQVVQATLPSELAKRPLSLDVMPEVSGSTTSGAGETPTATSSPTFPNQQAPLEKAATEVFVESSLALSSSVDGTQVGTGGAGANTGNTSGDTMHSPTKAGLDEGHRHPASENVEVANSLDTTLDSVFDDPVRPMSAQRQEADRGNYSPPALGALPLPQPTRQLKSPPVASLRDATSQKLNVKPLDPSNHCSASANNTAGPDVSVVSASFVSASTVGDIGHISGIW